MNDYYITIDADNNVIDSFTTGFHPPEVGDICVKENQSERCWSLPLQRMVDGIMVYQYVRDEQDVNKYRLLTDEEIRTPEFIAEVERQKSLRELAQTDTRMPRSLEDIIDVLIAKNTFKKDELPMSVQELHALKKEFREKI